MPSMLNRGRTARPPRVVNRLLRIVEHRRQRDDRARVEPAVRPPVEPAADAGRHGIIGTGVAQGARDADRVSGRLDLALDADDGVQPNELDRRGWMVQSWLARKPAAAPSLSTFGPTLKATTGLTAVWMTSCICSRSVQSCSSPKVS